jgi:hypothetical protein
MASSNAAREGERIPFLVGEAEKVTHPAYGSDRASVLSFRAAARNRDRPGRGISQTTARRRNCQNRADFAEKAD